MRWVRKIAEPANLATVRCATTTDLTTSVSARTAFDQLEKGLVREQLVAEQERLCVFCMRRIDEQVRDQRGEPTMKIAHRRPVSIEPSLALSWSNLFGSCDGGQRSRGRFWTCDAAQADTALSIDPASSDSIARLRYERRAGFNGLFLTSDDAASRSDLDVLGLNSGDLPALREAAWKGFQRDFRKHEPGEYGKAALRKYFPRWRAKHKRAPELLGVIEAKLK